MISEPPPTDVETPEREVLPESREPKLLPASFDDDGEPPAPRRRRWWPWLLVLVAVLTGVFFLTRQGGKSTKAAQGSRGGRGAAGAGNRPAPVLAANAVRKDIPVYLTGLGTVAPLNTVVVKSRVDGQLLRIRFQEGQTVRAGQLLAELDPRPFQVQLMQAEGQKAKDEAGLRNARVDLQRYEVLMAQDSIPRQQLDTQAALVAQFEAALESDQAQIEGARLNLSYSRITAPTAGRLGLRQVDVGNIVHAGDPNGLVVITQLQPIVSVFTIPADQLPQVLPRIHAGEQLAVEAYDRELTNRLAVGRLVAVDNQIDPTTGTVRLKALFPNENEALFPNQFINVRLLVDTLRGAVTVPVAALQHSPQGTFVYRIKPDRTVESRNVVVERTEGDDAALRTGLAPRDQVVVDGADKLRPGMKVDIGQPGGGQGPQGPRALGPGASGARRKGRR